MPQNVGQSIYVKLTVNQGIQSNSASVQITSATQWYGQPGACLRKHIESKEANKLDPYPNPFEDLVRIPIESPSLKSVIIQVYSISNILIKREVYPYDYPKGYINLDLEGYAPGIYLIRLVGQDQTYRIVKMQN